MEYKYYAVPESVSEMKAVFLQNGQVSCLFGSGDYEYWIHLPNEPPGLIDVVAGRIASVYALDNAGHIHFYTYWNQKWEQDPVASRGVSISGDKDFLYLTNEDGQVWAKDPFYVGGWQLVYDKIPDGQPIYWEYSVKAGDYLWKIVRDNYTVSDPNSILEIVNQIKTLNPEHTNWDRINPGMAIKMPPK